MDSINPEILSGFMRLIHDRLGIKIHEHQTKDIQKTIFEACQKFNCCPEEYRQMLMTCSDDSPLLEYLVAGVTVGETYFFRDKNQMQLLQTHILPELIKIKREQGDLSLRIWSAGCATGEELYTVAMLLYEILPHIKDWTLMLLGTDINVEVLQKARNGSYGEWSMRTINPYFKQRYFSLENHSYVLSPKIRDLAIFKYLNLNDDTYPAIFNGTNAQDLILCRNVLIYFGSEHIDRLMQKLRNSLVPGGYLLLGASDPISVANTDLVFYPHKGAMFSRPVAGEVIAAVKPEFSSLLSTTSVENISFQEKKQKIVRRDKKIAAPLSLAIKPSGKVDQTLITHLLSEARWQEALDAIQVLEFKEKKSAFSLRAQASVLASLGKLEQASKLCQESIALDPTDSRTYFTSALILMELNHLDEAEKMFRKTLFLDRQSVEVHFQLGLLLLRKKQHEAGLKCLQNALAIAEAKIPSSLVTEAQGLNYGRLVEILKREIELCSAARSVNHDSEDAKKQKLSQE